MPELATRRFVTDPGGTPPTTGPVHAELPLMADTSPPSPRSSNSAQNDLQIIRALRRGCTILAVSGSVTGHTVRRLQQAIHDAVADLGQPVVCELSQVSVLDADGVRMLLTVGQSSCSPNVPVCLAAPTLSARALLQHLGAGGLIQVSGSLAEARHPSSLRSPCTREQRYGRDDPNVPGAARRFVGDICAAADLADLRDDAVLATSELITNAIVHARTELLLQVQLTPPALSISVTDRGTSPWPAQPRPLGQLTELDEHGRGLGIVDAVADASGFHRPPAGGGTAWCTFHRRLGGPAGRQQLA